MGSMDFASYISMVGPSSLGAGYCPACGWNPLGPEGGFIETDRPEFQRVLSGESGLMACTHCHADLRVVPDGLVLDV